MRNALKNFFRLSRNIHFLLLSLQEGVYGQNSAALLRTRPSVTRITHACAPRRFFKDIK